MTRIFTGVLALVFVVAATVAAAQTNVAGAWDMTLNGPQGMMELTMTLTQDGDAVSGTIDGPMGAVEVSGAVAGNLMKLNFDVDAGGQMISISMIGEVDGAAMTGSLDFGQGTADFTAKRK